MFSALEPANPEESEESRKRRLAIIFVVVAIIATALVISSTLWFPQAYNPGDLAPDFSLTDVDGTNFTLSDYRGKVVLMNFMTTYCKFCRAEIIELESVWQLYNHSIVTISIDIDPFETDEQIRAFRDSFQGATWTWSRATDGISVAYEVSKIPKTVIVDKNGLVAFTHIGGIGAATLISEVQQLIG
jgi:thiol-disulfide isomerase/thioredoxin